MIKSRKLLAVVLVLCMILSLGVFANAESPIDRTGETVILHSNDVHGAIDGYAQMAALAAQYEDEGAEVILVDAGDFIQGTTYVSVSQGETAIALMNAVGYDIATLGNHEFDYGYENLTTILGEADFETICANVMYNGSSAFEGNTIYTTETGVKIGFFGVTTPETATKAHPAKIVGVTFLAEKALYAAAQAQVDALKAADCDLIIALSHLGVDPESAPNRSTDLYANVTGIDFIIDGHSHTVMTSGENGEPIQSTGTKFESIGVIVIGKDGAITSNALISFGEDSAYNDEAVKAQADKIKAEIEAVYGAKFATTEVLLNGERDPGNRTEGTNLGDLITDAMLWYALKDGDAFEVPAANIVAITNGGGIRATIEAGDITMNDINTVLPFGNTVAIVYVTGAELLESLEASTYCTPLAVGAFPQTAGIEFTIDGTVRYDQGEAYGTGTYFAPASINRVTITSVNGKAFDENATYGVVTNDFLAAGGDTYGAFAAATAQFDTGVPLDEAVMAYITEELGGVITEAAYGEARGDATIIYPPFSDVEFDQWFYDYVIALYGEGVISGMGDGTFAPNGTLTWGQALKLVLIANGNIEDTKVEGAAWADDYIDLAVELGLIEDANADQIITRLEFCTLAAKLFGFEEADITADTTFTDCEDGFVAALVEAGVINGMGDGTFAPDGALTRAQISKIIYLLMETAAVAA